MLKTSRKAKSTIDDVSLGDATPPPGIVVAALSGMGAAWMAAGSTGFVAEPLRHALTCLALGVAVVAAWPRQRVGWEVAVLAVALGAAAVTAAVGGPIHHLLAVTLVTAALAQNSRGVARRVFCVVSLSATVLAVFRLASYSIPTVWSLADWTGRGLGQLAGLLLGKPLWVGASFGGVDFLVLMAALIAAWLVHTRPPRLHRAFWTAAAVIGGHGIYLALLAMSTDLEAALPQPPPLPPTDLYEPPPWHWSEAASRLLPWNLPILAAAIQLVVAGFVFRWSTWLPAAERDTGWTVDAGRWTKKSTAATKPSTGVPTLRGSRPPSASLAVLAVLIPLLTVFSPGSSDMTGRRIVAFDEGFLDWEKPAFDNYGRASAGMCGMLPAFVESLGGTFAHSAELSQEDLAQADVLLLIHTVRPWPNDRSERVWDFVRGGGSLLLAAEPRVHEEGLVSAFDEVLGFGEALMIPPHAVAQSGDRPQRRAEAGPTDSALRVCFDTAISQAGSWQHSQQVLAHPATTGVGGRRNRFGIWTASSIDARWPGRPLVVGRWGWSDPGSDAVMTDVFRYDAGEKLGDLVLAAELPVGDGRVVVLGDTSCLTNEAIADSYPFTGRLLAYLAGSAGSSQAAWRQGLGSAVCLLLVGALLRCLAPGQLAVVAIALVLALTFSEEATHSSRQVLPRGPVACIDASHLEAYDDRAWGYDSIDGLTLTLIRNGYLPLVLPELTAARLADAELLISVAPARRFSPAERSMVADFVNAGGILLVTAGAEEAAGVNSLLADYDFCIPKRLGTRPGNLSMAAGEDLPEPAPMGNARCQYLDTGQYQAHAILYAGWPIECRAGRIEVLATGFRSLPVIALASVGQGTVVVIGDTAFAMNKNLENAGGEPFDGRYENAQFWRWLIGELTDRPEWTPPPPREETGTGEEQDGKNLGQLDRSPPAIERLQDPAGDEVAR